ncbi:ATP-binding protein [Candidatus Micrarchaeota archaeon]|nr:ATP-binding protein [Candidatus Micrarchaeota archaeon]
MVFYNRKSELAFFENRLESESAQLIILEGRRRIGKTELVKRLMETNPNALYLFVNDTEPKLILDEFAAAILQQRKETVRFDTPSQLYAYLAELASRSDQKLLVVFDEFQRFFNVERGFITALQAAWDSKLRHLPNLMLVLCGSSVSLMQKLASVQGAPLYGRNTGERHLSPFRYVDFRQAFPGFTEAERIRAYAIFGGTPHFFTQLKESKSPDFIPAIRRLILEVGAPLREEPRHLFVSEVRRSARYHAILQAIAEGHRTSSEIANHVSSRTARKTRPTSLPSYIDVLSEQLDILERDEPVGGKEKHGRYKFRDPFFEFWYRFVFPNQEALELGNYPFVEEKILQSLPALEGMVFERICREFLAIHNNRSLAGLPLNLTRLGSWWSRKNQNPADAPVEIDIVAQNGEDFLVGEVKYRTEPMGASILKTLVESKSQRLPFRGRFQFVAFSKSGFTSDCEDYARKTGCILFDLMQMAQALDEYSAMV